METSRRTGTQSVARAVSLLREIAARGQFGWGLGDLAVRCGIDKGTAHRLLAHLKRERLVQQRAHDRHYTPGPLLYELSLALPEYRAFVDSGRVRLERLVNRVGGVAFLFLRSGCDFVCAARAGGVRVTGLSIDVGTRRPLLTSAGGIAILIAMPAGEAQAVIAQNTAVIATHGGLSVATLERMLKLSQAHQLAINEQSLIPGWNAYALAVRDAQDVPFASVMIAGPSERLSRTDPQLMRLLAAEAASLGREAARTLASRS